MGKIPFHSSGEAKSIEFLQQFIDLFKDKGWLNQSIRIKYGDGRYRILCDEEGFIVYRINDKSVAPAGVTGWPVCIINQNVIVENSEMSLSPPAEPNAREWLKCLSNGNFEVM